MLLELWLWGTAGITFLMLIGFVIGTIRTDNSVVDILWGPAQIAFLASGAAAGVWLFDMEIQFSLGLIGIILWGGRLSIHISQRNKNKPEDSRYKGFRTRWGQHQLLGALFQVYLLQAILAAIVALPIAAILAADKSEPWYPGIIAGLILWIIGFLFEAVADWQLGNFKHRGGTGFCRRGLWGWSRHPNYFGEVVLWWGFGLYALAYSSEWLSLLSPVLMTVLILKVSGVPMLEASMKKRQGFADYAAATNEFFPWWPKTGKSQRD